MNEARTQSIEPQHRQSLVEVSWEGLDEPGCYVDEGTGDLYRVPKEAFVNGGSPIIVRESFGASRMRRLSNDPYMASLKARILCAQHNITPNF